MVLYCAHLCIKCSLGSSNFLEEISTISHSVVFFYFFALVTEEGFLISPCYSWELCILMGLSFLFLFAFRFSSQIFVRPSQTAIFPFCISFSWRWSWSLSAVQCHEPPSIVHQALYHIWSLEFICHFHCMMVRDWFRSYLHGLVVFPTFFNLSLNFAIRSSWSEPQLAPGLVFADCIELLHLWLQRL